MKGHRPPAGCGAQHGAVGAALRLGCRATSAWVGIGGGRVRAGHPSALGGDAGHAGDGDAERLGWRRGSRCCAGRAAELRPAYEVPESLGAPNTSRAGCPVGFLVPRLRGPGGSRPDGGAAGVGGAAMTRSAPLARMIASKEATDLPAATLDC